MRSIYAVLIAACLCACEKDKTTTPTTTTPTNNGGGGGGQQTVLTAPALIAPPNNVGHMWGQISYSWDAVPGADYYEARSWYYLNGGGQGTFTLSYPNLTTTSITPNSTIVAGNGWEGKVIYWHVRAYDGAYPNGTAGPWSQTYSFTLNP